MVCERAYYRFDREKELPGICASLARRGGGALLLGVIREGEVTGSAAFKDIYSELSGELSAKLGIRVEVEVFMHPQGRVLIFHVSTRT